MTATPTQTATPRPSRALVEVDTPRLQLKDSLNFQDKLP